MSFHSGVVRVRCAPPRTRAPRVTSTSSDSERDHHKQYTPYPARRQSASRLVQRNDSHRRTARRLNSAPRASQRRNGVQLLTPWLHKNATLHLLIRAVLLPRRWPSWAMVVHTAACRNSQWTSVGVVREAPNVLVVTCTAEQMATRLIRLCMHQQLKDGTMGKEVGFCIVRTATVLAECDGRGDDWYEAQLQCDAIGGRDCGVVQLAAACACNASGGVSVVVTAGISMQKEVRGCWMQVWRVADRRGMLVQERIARGDEFTAVEISSQVLWFGSAFGNGNDSSAKSANKVKMRLVFVRRWWRKRFVMGALEVSVAQMRRLREGDLLKMRWMQSPLSVEGVRCVVVDRVVLATAGAVLHLRLSR